ncbi:hypothetical protein IQ250_28400 [Pseudanabaenaceae cyanobacterium LEGE 13415]|nr:hypothetical protein [Pseudanabaenaceae cyanobacterium LEGE 13415]
MFLTESNLRLRKTSSVVKIAIELAIAPEFPPDHLNLRFDLAWRILLVVIQGKSA